MLFIEVDETDQLDALRINGVLGLSPGSSLIQTFQGDQSNSFLDNLYDQGLIDERVFSLYLTGIENFRNESMLTVGGYDIDRFAYN